MFCSIFSFAQQAKPAEGGNIPKYMIILTQNQMDELFLFVGTDIYNDKGRTLYLQDLKSRVYLLPTHDSTAKKENSLDSLKRVGLKKKK